MVKKKYPWNKGNKKRVELICECGKSFCIVPSQVKYGAKYCSQKCFHKYTNHNHTQGKHWKLSKETKIKQGLHQIGEKNHNWKGGITNPRRNKECKKWMRAIKKRDKFCVICGNNKNLEAHHLNSFDSYPKQRYDLDNGIVLCNKHHEEFHKKYGYGKNTRKQFEEFNLERIESIKKIDMRKSTIYNISLEGDSPFYANGILTHNTPPHVITPKEKGSLKFKGKDGKFIFVKKVNHPGTRPNPFIRNTIQNKLKNIIIEEIMR